ncbi:MAG: hypothetical protein WKF83_05680 [Nocardioidaceae bacterium]
MARAYAELRETAGLGETDAWPASAAPAVPLRTTGSSPSAVPVRRPRCIEALSDYRARPARSRWSRQVRAPRSSTVGDPIFVPQFDEQSVVQTRFATSVLALLRAHLGEDLG